MPNKKSIAFVCATNYHIIVSYFLRSFFKDYKKILIINKSSFDALVLFDSIKQSNHWDEVIGIESDLKKISLSNIFIKFYNHFLLRTKIKKIIKNNNISEVVVFTMGDIISNFFSGSNLLKKIYLGEDGMYPYIGGIEVFDSKKTIKNTIKKFFFKEFYIDFKDRIDELILLKPNLFNPIFDSKKKNIKNGGINSEQLKAVFTELNTVFSYSHHEIYKEVDVIFFDSAMISKELDVEIEQFEYTFKLLSNIFPKNKKILIKMSRYATKYKIESYNRLKQQYENIYIDYANLNTPWEIIYFNNLDNLKNATLASYWSGACLTPYLLFNIENDIVILSKFLLNHKGISSEYESIINSFINFSEKINDDFEHKSIYFPTKKAPIHI